MNGRRIAVKPSRKLMLSYAMVVGFYIVVAGLSHTSDVTLVIMPIRLM